MSVKIRLRRMGRKKRPIWSVVATDSRSARDGRYIEDLGRYRPLDQPALVRLNEERVLYWLEQGAKPSDTVRSLLSKRGLMLALHLRRKGASDEEVQQAVAEHREMRADKEDAIKMTAADRREEALEAERARVAELEEEDRKRRAEEERKRKEAEEKAKAEAAAKAKAEAEAKAKEEAEAADEEAAEGDTEESQAAADAETEDVATQGTASPDEDEDEAESEDVGTQHAASDTEEADAEASAEAADGDEDDTEDDDADEEK